MDYGVYVWLCVCVGVSCYEHTMNKIFLYTPVHNDVWTTTTTTIEHELFLFLSLFLSFYVVHQYIIGKIFSYLQ